ncbi:MAG: tetratricopeptide repeat protein [Pseudomonadota bacterium]
MKRTLFLAVVSLLVTACTEQESKDSATVESPVYVGGQACAECHEPEYQQWRSSHHDLAMAPANEKTVLGDFDQANHVQGAVVSNFFRKNGEYWVRTEGADGELQDFQIAYTFGVEPLQQYLVRFPKGRLQALILAWDTRSNELGGQRWFHLYPDEEINHKDPLHWTGPMHNWNHMCAECHSTDVRKNYDSATDTFDTRWSEHNVSCESCHGPGSLHVQEAKTGGLDSAPLIAGLKRDVTWVMNANTGIAEGIGSASNKNEINRCAGCHSRRSTLQEGHSADAFLNTHRPSLLDPAHYFSDGQILDEVYVYGSFLQSAMHQAGVSCADCHNPHTLKTRVVGNGLCGQCHLAEKFDQPTHHRHESDSEAAQCVSCHMPSRTYMVVDDRRDHSFRIPRPHVTQATGSPNACNQCHEDESVEWAMAQVETWYGDPEQTHYGEVLHGAHQEEAGAQPELRRLIEDESQPGIVRATAVSMLNASQPFVLTALLNPLVSDADSLVRMATADAGALVQRNQRMATIGALLRDEQKAVRLAAVNSLLDVPRDSMSAGRLEDFDQALTEYVVAQNLHADRAEAQFNLGRVYSSQGDLQGAVAAYQKAIQKQPWFAPSYVNLADLYKQAGREEEVEQLLNKGIEQNSRDPSLRYAFGLSLVRQGKHQQALAAFKTTRDLAPDSSHYAYVLGVAYNSYGDSAAAITELEAAHQRWPDNKDILLGLATMLRDVGELGRAKTYTDKLVSLYPSDRTVQQLLRQLQ